jgi:hypothetical protein
VVSGWWSSFTVWWTHHTAWVLRRTSPRTRAWLRASWWLLLIAGGAAACLRMASAEEWRKAWAIAAQVGAPLVVLFLLPAVSLFVKSLGWRSLLPVHFRPGVGRSYATFVAAQGVNELGFSLLGEPLKVLVLPRAGRAVGIAAVGADNALAFAALLSVTATLTIGSPGALLMAGLAGGAVFFSGQVSTRVPRYVAAFSAHYVGKLWLCVELGLGLYWLREPALAAVAPLSLAWTTAAALGAPVPGQLGVVEAALVHSGSALGITASSLLALALIRRLRALLWMIVGLLLAARLTNRTTTEVSDASTPPTQQPSQPSRVARRAVAPEPLSQT